MKINLHKVVVFCCCFLILGFSVPSALAEGSSISTQSSSSVGTAPQIDAQTAVLIDVDTMQILYDKDMHKQMYPASITKIMTGVLAAEMGKADDVVTVSQNVGKSQGKSVSCIGLEPGEQVTQDSLMYTMFLASANDSAYELAEHIGGTVDNFINLMNDRAQVIGATDTHFANPNGLPDKNNYTSAYDMALISREAVNNANVLKYFGAVSQTIPADNVLKSCQYGTLVNMLRSDSRYYYPGIIAAKSGWIEMSGFTLVTAAKRNNRTLICVQMKGSSWDGVYKGSIDLFNYGFAQPVQPKVTAAINTLSSGIQQTNKNSSLNISSTASKSKNYTSHIAFILLIVAGSAAFVIFCMTVYAKIKAIKRRRMRARVRLKAKMPYDTNDSASD